MIVNEYNGSLVERTIDGNKETVKNLARSIHFALNSVFKGVKYLIEAKKNDKDKVQSVRDRASYIKTNCSFTNPTMLAGTPEHAQAVIDASQGINDEMVEHYLKHAPAEELKLFYAIQNMKGITEEERAKALKSFIAYELVMAFHPDEMEGMNRDEKAAIITEIQHEFYKDFTGNQTLKHKYFGAIQFDTENPHEQFMISSYDFDGRRLNLHNNYQRFQDFIAKMETHPKYGKYLKSVVTAKREANEFPNKEDRLSTEQILNSCFAKNALNYLETKSNLAEHNIMLD
ncbi:relaxase/mobilization nuclease domain-containing protein, partial [Pseudomonas sp. PA-3-6H]